MTWTLGSVISVGSSPASVSSLSPAGLPSWASLSSSVASTVEPSLEPSSVPSPSPSPSVSETPVPTVEPGACGTLEAPCYVEAGSDLTATLLGFGVVLLVSVLISTVTAVRLLTR